MFLGSFWNAEGVEPSFSWHSQVNANFKAANMADMEVDEGNEKDGLAAREKRQTRQFLIHPRKTASSRDVPRI